MRELNNKEMEVVSGGCCGCSVASGIGSTIVGGAAVIVAGAIGIANVVGAGIAGALNGISSVFCCKK